MRVRIVCCLGRVPLSLACHLLLVLAVASGPIPARAELTVEQVQKLLADDGMEGARFGTPVAIDGDTALIAARHEDGGGGLSASVYAFARESGIWAQQEKFVLGFGSLLTSMAIDGDTALMGAPEDDGNGINAGAAYVFVRREGGWSQQAVLRAEDGDETDLFGSSVAIDGDVAVIGASFDDENGDRSGSVYVFTRIDEAWMQQAKLLPDDGAPGDQFGVSVALDGDTALIGAWRDDDVGGDSGSVYAFFRTGDVWSQSNKLLAGDGSHGYTFGLSVALEGDTCIIGAPKAFDIGNQSGAVRSGAAYVFARQDGVWTQQAKLIADEPEEGDWFGWSVSIDADTALVGAPRDYVGSGDVFVRKNGAWTHLAKLLPDDGLRGALFGESVAIAEDMLLIGASATDDLGADSGSAYVFRIFSDPIDLLNALVEHVRALALHHGTESSLIAKLHTALALLTDLAEENDHAAQNVLGAFINQVEAQHGKKIAPEDADGLIADAQEIIDLLAAE